MGDRIYDEMTGRGRVISRSEARRLASLIGQFREATLDFTGVRGIGQAFVHELFVVRKKDHPDFIMNIENASDDVLGMIRRVENTKQETVRPIFQAMSCTQA